MELTQELVRKLLHYDPETGVFTWKERSGEDSRIKSWNTRRAGHRAGALQINPKGYTYRVIRLGKKIYREHRLAFLYVTGSLPSGDIDHLNRDATDNRWHNLKDSDKTSNNKNFSISSKNTSGVTGVCWCKRKGKWKAKAGLNGKTVNVGLFEDIREAEKAIKDFRINNGYSPGHGGSRHY